MRPADLGPFLLVAVVLGVGAFFLGPVFLVGVALVATVPGGLAALVVALRAPFDPETELVTPEQVAARFPAAGPGHGRDQVWPHYLAAQARVDLAAMLQAVWTGLGEVWEWAADHKPFDGPGRSWWYVGGLLLVVESAAAVLTGLAATAVAGVVLLLAGLAWAGVGGAVRLVESLLHRRARASARCPSCFWRTSLPSYACTCGLVHRDVRPGLLGVTRHRCRCGRAMPTTVTRAGRDHDPQCPQCDQVLERGSGAWTDVSVPVFGPASAGKTSLIYAGLEALRRQVEAGGGTLEARRDADAARFRAGVEQVRAGRVAKTEAGAAPVGLVCTVAVRRRRALLHTFDAAGELFATRAGTEELRFLDEAGRMMLVVDPFSIPEVAAEVLRGPEDTAAAAPAVDPPETAYRATVLRLQDSGVRLDRTDLAVVVVKADLLVDEPIARDLCPERHAVRDWLRRQRQDHLVSEAERDFGEVGYFLVSSRTGWDPGDRHTALAPLRWLAERGRLPLPPPTAVAAPAEEPAS